MAYNLSQQTMHTRLAILDMYQGVPNEGMRCIRQLVNEFSQEIGGLEVQTFEVRQQQQLPPLEDFDLFISTGGPGDPLDWAGWGPKYFALIDELLEHNRYAPRRKYLFLICHSFQMVSHHLGVARISKRKSTSFGTFPIHQTVHGRKEPFFEALPEPFWAVDSRDYQLTNANWERLRNLGGRIMAREKIRPHVRLERAIMAIRFTTEVFGTQFHPEADAAGMLHYFQMPEKQQQVIAAHGIEKYYSMLDHLNDPDKILLTESVIIPTFLRSSYAALLQQTAAELV